ncbi:MAG: hypothetical protein A3I09_02270 [Deltaproteobacteria bacterium RIFCSPLOWO2_02_FULL_47_10]|nr:MAG: hypothetical protein A3I09_02270 [Deltaproteobacteria bacterium RIFCSPLOWO2_02_FULL_47_10]
MKHLVLAIGAIFALTIAGSAIAADEHKGHEHKGQMQQGSVQAAPAAYKCPMHPDAISTKAGKCPKCGMGMATANAKIGYRCPMHHGEMSDKPGKCPKCNMDYELYDLKEKGGVGTSSK